MNKALWIVQAVTLTAAHVRGRATKVSCSRTEYITSAAKQITNEHSRNYPLVWIVKKYVGAREEPGPKLVSLWDAGIDGGLAHTTMAGL